MLSHAYGGSSLWETLEKTLRRQSLNSTMFLQGVANRLNSLSSQWPKSNWSIREEIVFYLSFAEFLRHYNAFINQKGCKEMPWRDLLFNATQTPISDISTDTVEEVGVLMGVCLGKMEWLYSKHHGDWNKSFFKERVMRIGGKIMPETTIEALQATFEVAISNDIKLSSDFKARLGIVGGAVRFDLWDKISKDKKKFMVAFWLGFSINAQAFFGSRGTEEVEVKTDVAIALTEEGEEETEAVATTEEVAHQ